MRLSQLARAIPAARRLGEADPEIEDVQYDSRRVTPGALFVAIVGFRDDGHRYVASAVAKGAAAVVVERPEVVPPGVPALVVPSGREALPALAGAFFHYPWSRLRLIGVTGTNGKTTTTFLIRAVLREAGRRVGLIGTVEVSLGEEVWTAERTTPESADLFRLLSIMAQRGLQDVVMEVASHALSLGRVAGVEFDVAVFTNLSQDHLDFHGTMEAYCAAKERLFLELGRYRGPFPKGGTKLAVINAMDPVGERYARAAAGSRILRYGRGEGVDVAATEVVVRPAGTEFLLVAGAERERVQLGLTGGFNVDNALAAAAVGVGLGIPLPVVAAGLASVQGVPGRFERVDEGQPFTVVVDYAHTPDGLENVLRAARNLAQGRVLAVFGCGGDRDRGKRPLMGEIGARLADLAILTSDNPRTEDPDAILDEVEEGARRAGGRYVRERDRAQAIRWAVREARPGDVVVIAGKGHETYQILGDRVVPFDDRVVAREALREMGWGDGG